MIGKCASLLGRSCSNVFLRHKPPVSMFHCTFDTFSWNDKFDFDEDILIGDRYEDEGLGGLLEKYGVDLTQKAREGKIDPVIGRNEIIRRVIQILSRRWKNNPALIGEPGVGKTAICEGLALRMAEGAVPFSMRDKKLVRLDLINLIAGTSHRGELEERISTLVDEIKEREDEIILFIDEMHQLQHQSEVGDFLKPELSRGTLHCIGATTLSEYAKTIEKDGALSRRFQSVYVPEPTEIEAIGILKGLSDRLELFYGLGIEEDAILAAVHGSVKYLKDKFLPDKALDLLDEALAGLKISSESKPEILDILEREIINLRIEREVFRGRNNDEGVEEINSLLTEKEREEEELRDQWDSENAIIEERKMLRRKLEKLEQKFFAEIRSSNYTLASQYKYQDIPLVKSRMEELNSIHTELISESVGEEHIYQVISRTTGIPVERLKISEREKLLNMEEVMGESIKGQEHVLKGLASTIRIAKAGLREGGPDGGPIGSFIFLGPTGTGKTFTAKMLAEFLFDDPRAVLRIDMSEFMERFNVSRLIGAPPGYVGYDEGGGILTEPVRRRPYQIILFDEFEKADREIANLLLQILDEGHLTDSHGRRVDFSNTIIIMTSNVGSEFFSGGSEDHITSDSSDSVSKQTKTLVMEKLKQQYPPEFLNRIDEILIFNELSKEKIFEITKLEVTKVRNRVRERSGFSLEFEDEIVLKYLSEMSYNPNYGARPLKRMVNRLILNPLTELILSNEVGRDDVVWTRFDEKNQRIYFEVESASSNNE